MTYRRAKHLYLIEQIVPAPPPVDLHFYKTCLWFTGQKQIGKKVILRRNRRYRRQDTYEYVVPRNPKTVAQQANRNKFRDAMTAWTALTPEQQEPWEIKARGKQLYGKSLFVKHYMLNTP